MARFISGLTVAVWLLATTLAMAPARSEEVWALRTRFTVTMSEASIDYAEEDAQWRIMFRDGHVAADNIGFAVEFDNGTTLYNTDLACDRTEREAVTTPYGEGTRCHVFFKAQDGAVVEHALTFFKNRPFVLLEMAVTNAGDTPLTVRRFVPVLANAGQMPGLGPATEVTRYPLSIRGGEPVYDPSGPGSWTIFRDPAANRTVALGLLPTGGTQGGMELVPAGEGWAGPVFFDHTPGTVLAPGERTETGTVWMAAGVKAPDDMILNYGWAFAGGGAKTKRTDTPRAWVTVADDQSLGDLLKTARAHQSGIRCALIPASWEGRPGSMRGAAPGYPGSMSSAAGQLAAMNIAPGITLDPLAGDGGKEDWIVKSADGQAWLNPANSDAAEAVKKRVRRTLGWGFQFVAVAPSGIPDEALKAMNLTRAKANALALELTRDAAGNVPVVVAGSGVSAGNAAAWRLAADTVKAMSDYGAAPAAMRLDADALDTLTEEGIAALRDWAGPIEVVGTGKSALRRELSRDVLAGQGGPPPRVEPITDSELDEIETAAEDTAEETSGPVVPEEEQPEKTAEGKGLFRGIKKLGQSIF